jgi:hypothetical protein
MPRPVRITAKIRNETGPLAFCKTNVMSDQNSTVPEIKMVHIPLDTLKVILGEFIDDRVTKVIQKANDPWRNLPPHMTLKQCEIFMRNKLGLKTTHQTIRKRIEIGVLTPVENKTPTSLYTEDLKAAVHAGLFNAKKI